MKLIKDYRYWIASFFGYIIIFFVTLGLNKIADYKGDQPNAKLQYYTVESIECGILAFFISLGLLFYIEKYVNLVKFNMKAVTSFSIVLIISQITYSLLIWPILNSTYFYFLNYLPKHTFKSKLTNIPYFMSMFLIWLFVIFVIKLYNHLKAETINSLKLESTLKESQLNALKGQINPHFMFNSLNNIRGLVLENPNKSREMITRLSEMLRYSLTKDDTNTIALEEEIEMVENFIEISKIQLEERLQFISDVKTDALKLKIPPMIIQMLVENAVKHGISKLKEGGQIIVRIKCENNFLHIKVINTGKLVIEKDSTQLGIKNIKKRLHLLYGEKGVFKLKEIDNHVIATILIPIM